MTFVKYKESWPPGHIIREWMNENFPKTFWYFDGAGINGSGIKFADPRVATMFVLRWE